jgi:maltooligosyltrehalose trehalohydrolase
MTDVPYFPQYGPVIFGNGGHALFSLWAPSAESVAVQINGGPPQPMRAISDDCHVIDTEARHGDRYSFVIDDKTVVPDPASRFQPEGVNGPSQLINSAVYNRPENSWKGRPWEEAVIYELHVGTFSLKGTFADVEKKLDYLADLGFTAIELMPIAAFGGNRGWGYDGVLPYAPHAAYGRPEDVKRLVMAAHEKNLMIFLDVVYNHFGPEGNYLGVYAAPFFTDRYSTPWGKAIDFGQRHVRDFFVDNALYWLKEYGFDGLRFDAVHAIHDASKKHFLAEMAERIHAALPQDRHVHLILENEKNEARWLERGKTQKPIHYTAQWGDDFHNTLRLLLTGEEKLYRIFHQHEALELLARCLTENFAHQGEVPTGGTESRGEPSTHLSPEAIVVFRQNHDQVGNDALGRRLPLLASANKVALSLAVVMLSPHIPMLFMGEEWNTKQPFQFFSDYKGKLADAVKKGRFKEVEHSPEFSTPELRDRIPDPNNEQTFLASHLDWNEATEDYHKAAADITRRLIAVRRKEIVPLSKAGWKGAAQELVDGRGLDCRWDCENGQTLQLLANLSDDDLKLNPGNIRPGRVIWNASDDEGAEGIISAWGGQFRILTTAIL